MHITVAICTWNRATILEGTLKQLCDLRVPVDVDWELLIVDNNSPDDTRAVVNRYVGKLPVRYIQEPRQGIAFARNAAIASANGELLIFLDDDCRPEPELLSEYWSTAAANPAVDAFGGTMVPDFEAEPPKWVSDNLDLLSSAFARLVRPGPNRILAPTESVFTANMAIRTCVLRNLPFDTRLGYVGSDRIGGEDLDFCVRLRQEGKSLMWVGSAVVKHYIRASSVRPRAIWRKYVCDGRLEVRFGELSTGMSAWSGFPRWAIRQYILAAMRRIFYAPVRSRAWLEAFIRMAAMHGVLSEAIRRGNWGFGRKPFGARLSACTPPG